MPILKNFVSIIHVIAIIITCKFICARKDRGEYLAKSLEKLGPSFIKFGQALSVRPDIVGEEISASLERLQDRMPPFPTLIAKKIIEKDLQKTTVEIFSEFGDAIAAASIAQVHKATTLDGKIVAVKILRPGIERKFKYDLALFYFIAHIISLLPSTKRLRLKEVVDVFAVTVKKELDLRMEAASASELRENCGNDENFYVPQIYWQYTARRVMVLEWVNAIPIGDKQALIDAGLELKKVSENLAISFLNQAFRDGFFHADIHPGNLFVDKFGNIVPVDFGIMGRLDKPTRMYVAQILRGFITGDYMHVAQIHLDAGYVPQNTSAYDFALACRAIGGPIMGLPANQVSIARLLALLFKVTEDFNMQTQPQLLLLQKTMVLIEGVGQNLYPDVNMWQMAEGWISDWANKNMSFEAHLKECIGDIISILRNVPKRIKDLDKIIELISMGKK